MAAGGFADALDHIIPDSSAGKPVFTETPVATQDTVKRGTLAGETESLRITGTLARNTPASKQHALS